MNKFKLALAISLGLIASTASAQDIPNHSLPVGRGPGVVGWGVFGPCTTGQVPVWSAGSGADPTCGFPGPSGVLPVTQGGTGLSSIPTFGVMLGNNTSPVNLAFPITAGNLFIDQGAAANPAFKAMSGDATITSLGALTIANNAVTVAKMATIANSTVIGNFSGATATPAADSVPSCASDGTHALTNNASGGFNCTAITGVVLTAPIVTVVGSGTYNTPANALYLVVELVGGGGGGGGNGTSGASAGGNGGNTTFSGGVVSLTANGGNGGALATGTSPSAVATGGTASGGDINITGNPGFAINTSANAIALQNGGASIFGGAGPGGGASAAGIAASANSGSGGGGAGAVSGTLSAAGGGAAGGYSRKLITSPNATFTAVVGGAGAAGTAGASGHAGGAGGAGFIIVTAYFQ